jgi:hypothetical protein
MKKKRKKQKCHVVIMFPSQFVCVSHHIKAENNIRKAISFFSLIFLGNPVIIQTIRIQIDKKIADNFDNKSKNCFGCDSNQSFLFWL